MAKKRGDTFMQECCDYYDQAAGGDNCLTKFELCKVVRQGGCEKETEEIASWFDDIDTNDDDKVTKDEFLKAMGLRDPAEVSEMELTKAFKQFDLDGSGCITKDEVQQVLQNMGYDEEQEAVLDMDENDDGKVSYREFVQKVKEGYK